MNRWKFIAFVFFAVVAFAFLRWAKSTSSTPVASELAEAPTEVSPVETKEETQPLAEIQRKPKDVRSPLLQEEKSKKEGEVESWYKQAQDLGRQGRYEAEQALLEEILRTDPKNERALLELARLNAHSLNAPRKAEALFRRALEVNPENPAILDELIHVASDPSNPNSSATLVRELYESYPKSDNLAAAYGRSLMLQGQGNEAIPYLTRASGNPRHAEAALMSLAEIHHRSGDAKSAVEAYSRLTSFQENALNEVQRQGFNNPDLEEGIARSQVGLATVLISSGQRDRAEVLLQTLAQRYPDNPEVADLLAHSRSPRQ